QLVLSTVAGKVFINGGDAIVDTYDIPASNGVIHLLNDMITP
ncbi:MAG: fasciclin domain-containing protein, partial [Chloroflexota bacterium]